MMGSAVLADVIARLRADAPLVALLGGANIYRNRSRTSIQTPCIVWSLVHEGVEENYANVTIQWDVFTNDAASLLAIEQALYRLLHSDTLLQYDSLLMWSAFQTKYDLHDENQGLVHSALEYVFKVPRFNG